MTLLAYHLCSAPVSGLFWHYALDQASPLQQHSGGAWDARGGFCKSLQEGTLVPRVVRG